MMYFAEIKNIANDIVKFALPIAAGNMLITGASLINLQILGKHNQDNLYILAVFAPVYYVFLAFQESFRSTVVTVVSRHYRTKSIRGIMSKVMCIVLVAGALAAFAISAVSHWLAIKLHIALLFTEQFQWFSQAMGWVNIILTVSVVLNALVLGMGFPRTSFAFTLMGCLLTTLMLIFQLHYSYQGLRAFVSALWMTHIMCGLFILLYLSSRKQPLANKIRWDRSDNHMLMKSLSKTGIPLFVSYLIIFSGVAIFNMILAQFGTDAVAGYGIVCRIQMLIILPAIGMGTALAILINYQVSSMKENAVLRIIIVGIAMSIILYGVLGELMYSYRNQVINLFTSTQFIRQSAVAYLQHVSFSYVIWGPVIVFITMLEQIGYGLQAVLYHFCYFACIVLTVKCLMQAQMDYIFFYKIISHFNCISLVALLLFSPVLFKRFGRTSL